MITNLNKTCDEMRRQINSARRETAPMLDEALALTAQKQDVEAKQQLLSAFNKHFIMSEEDLTLLTSSTEPIDDRFFQTMNRVKYIRNDCEVLLGTENQNLGMELMEQTSRNINAAFQKLYNWIQREFKILDLEDPRISRVIRRALRVLAERPTLFQNCLNFFAEAREHTLTDAFHTALTHGARGSSQTEMSANPIELQTHDLLRYVGDMLAWVHSTTVSEREALEGLFISEGDEIAKEIQAGRDKEPWSRLQAEDEDGGEDMAMFDGRKALNELVNRNLEGVARVLKQRIGIAVQSTEDPLLVYKALNLLKFYEDIFSKLVGSPSDLANTIGELQTSGFAHFERLLKDSILATNTETVSDDLATPQFLLDALEQFKSFLNAGPDASGPDMSQLLSAALVPFLDQCSEMASTIPEPISQIIFQLNYLLSVHIALQPILPTSHGFLAAAQKKVNELREKLIGTQHSRLLYESGVKHLLDAIEEAEEAKGSNVRAFASIPAFNPKSLSASAAQLDHFLPSAVEDMLEKMKQLSDRGLATEIAQQAAESFCVDFERVEEAILKADEEVEESRGVGESGDGGSEEEEGEGNEILLRKEYSRTTAEIRILLSLG